MAELRPMSLYADGVRVAQEVRMHLRGRSTMSLRPDIWSLDIYSPSEDLLAAVHDAAMLQVEGEELSTLATGTVEEIYSRQEGNKSITTVILSDGMNFWSSYVSFQLAGGNSAQETIRALVQRCTSPVPIVALQAEDVTIPRGQTFHGKVAPYIVSLAKSIKARAFIVRGGLHLLARGAGTETLTFREADIVNDISEANGAYIVQLNSVRGYPIGQLVSFPELTASKFRLICQTVDADNREGLWKTELIMVDEAKIEVWDDWGGG